MLEESLKRLEQNLNRMELLKAQIADEYLLKEKFLDWALRYSLLESIQIVTYISCHLSSSKNLGNPETYLDCVKLLIENNYLPRSLEKSLYGMVKLRNLLSHEYRIIDENKLIGYLDFLDDFRNFYNCIEKFL